jgi:hypothetical protein
MLSAAAVSSSEAAWFSVRAERSSELSAMLSALDRIVSALRAICSITRTKVSTVSLKDSRKGSYSASNALSIFWVRSPPATV